MLERDGADGGVADWAKAHAALVQLALERSELEGREGRALLRAMRSGVHVHLGHGLKIPRFGGQVDYATRRTELERNSNSIGLR